MHHPPLRRAALALLCAVLAAPAAAGAPPCAIEESPAARAACLDARADRLLHAMAARLARVAALTGAPRARSDPLAGGLVHGQRRWRRAMEEACAAVSAPGRARARVARARCRHAAARRRAWRLDHALAGPAGPAAGLFGGLRPDTEILVPARPPAGPGPRPPPRP